jgi:transposase InsO family protein
VPEALRAFVLTRYHSLPVSGHKGKHKTRYAIQLRYYWPCMDRDILRWIRACPTCAKRKTPRPLNSRPPASVSESTRPWQQLSIDLVTAGAADDSVFPAKYILTVLDVFTRLVIAIPIASKSTKDVAEALFTHAFALHGRPSSIHSDDGEEFVIAGLRGH